MSESLAKIICSQVKKSINSSDKRFGLHEPIIGKLEQKYVNNALKSGYVSSVGAYVNQFEEELLAYTGSKYAIAVMNGTCALHLALRVLGVGVNHEVLVPSLTFVGSVNAIDYCNAVPHFIDVNEENLSVDYEKLDFYLSNNTKITKSGLLNLDTGRIIKAIMPVHIYGHIADIKKLKKLAKKYKLLIVEDAAEAFGSFFNNRHAGTFGDIGTLSFNGNKIITTGSGGAILTNNLKLAKLARHLSTTAKKPHRWNYIHDAVGYNYRMSNIHAAIGLAQIRQIKNFLKYKRKLLKAYLNNLDQIKGVRFLQEPKGSNSNYWLQTIILEKNCEHEKEKVLTELNKHNLMSRPCWALNHKMKVYKNCPKMDLSTSSSLEKRIINLPSNIIIK
jgi:perosamine synthetase